MDRRLKVWLPSEPVREVESRLLTQQDMLGTTRSQLAGRAGANGTGAVGNTGSSFSTHAIQNGRVPLLQPLTNAAGRATAPSRRFGGSGWGRSLRVDVQRTRSREPSLKTGTN
jgi:hypothetical protein